MGVITESQIRPLITEYESLKKSIIASDITDMRVVTIKPNQDLDLALKLLTKTDLKELPVVSEEDKNKVIGFISRQDILNIYNRESIKYDLADGLSREIQTLNRTDVSRIADGYAIVEKRPSLEFVGKTLSELKLRNKYGLEVLMIKKLEGLFTESESESKLIMPAYDYVIAEDDILVLFGTEDKIAQTNEW